MNKLYQNLDLTKMTNKFMSNAWCFFGNYRIRWMPSRHVSPAQGMYTFASLGLYMIELELCFYGGKDRYYTNENLELMALGNHISSERELGYLCRSQWKIRWFTKKSLATACLLYLLENSLFYIFLSLSQFFEASLICLLMAWNFPTCNAVTFLAVGIGFGYS